MNADSDSEQDHGYTGQNRRRPGVAAGKQKKRQVDVDLEDDQHMLDMRLEEDEEEEDFDQDEEDMLDHRRRLAKRAHPQTGSSSNSSSRRRVEEEERHDEIEQEEDSSAGPTFRPETMHGIFKGVWSDPGTKAQKDALQLSAEFLRLFTIEALHRTAAYQREQEDEELREDEALIELDSLEAIIPQLVMDF